MFWAFDSVLRAFIRKLECSNFRAVLVLEDFGNVWLVDGFRLMDCYWLPWSAGDYNHGELILRRKLRGGLKDNKDKTGLLCECFSCKYTTGMSIRRLLKLTGTFRGCLSYRHLVWDQSNLCPLSSVCLAGSELCMVMSVNGILMFG